MGQSCDCGMATPSLTGCPVLLLEVGSIISLSLLHQRSLPMSLGSLSPPRSLVHSGGIPPTSYFLRLLVYILSTGLQGFSPFPSPNTRSGPLSSPLPAFPTPLSLPGSFLSPSPLVIAFFSLPSETEASSPGHFSLLSLFNSVSCVFVWFFFLFSFLANIHLLVRTCHAYPFGSELPHSG